MSVDSDLERDVIVALIRNPDIEATALACRVTDGVATLRGYVRNLFQKHEAGRTAWAVAGVIAVANHIVVAASRASVTRSASSL